jgi:hypothetical protein
MAYKLCLDISCFLLLLDFLGGALPPEFLGEAVWLGLCEKR